MNKAQTTTAIAALLFACSSGSRGPGMDDGEMQDGFAGSLRFAQHKGEHEAAPREPDAGSDAGELPEVEADNDAGHEAPAHRLVCTRGPLRYELIIAGDLALVSCSAADETGSGEYALDGGNFECEAGATVFKLYRVGAFGSPGVYVVRVETTDGELVEVICE